MIAISLAFGDSSHMSFKMIRNASPETWSIAFSSAVDSEDEDVVCASDMIGRLSSVKPKFVCFEDLEEWKNKRNERDCKKLDDLFYDARFEQPWITFR